MNVLLGAESLRIPLTGIGRYTSQLADGLVDHPRVGDLRFYAHGRVLSKRPPAGQTSDESGSPASRRLRTLLGATRSVLAGSRLAVAAYERIVPVTSRLGLRRFSESHVLHAPSFVLPEYAGPKVVTIHDLSTVLMPECHPASRVGFTNRAIERAVERADHIITDSEFIRTQILQHYGVDAGRCSAIPLGAAPEFRVRSETECRAALDAYGLEYKRFCLFVSTIEPRKNLCRLLAAFEDCLRRGSPQLPLVIVGDRGWKSEPEHQAIQKLATEGVVRYEGYVPDAILPLLFSSAYLLAFPSLYEGYGLPALEAMQSGTAVLTSAGTVMEEVCGDAALLVDPKDTDSISNALETLLCDQEQVARLVESGLRRAAGFSWANCVERTLDVYDRLQ